MFVLLNALVDSEMMDFIVLNLLLMEEELDMFFGKKTNVSRIILKVVRKMELYGTLNVNQDSTMSDVVFVLLIVLLDGLILVFLAKNLIVMEEELDMLYLSDLNA